MRLMHKGVGNVVLAAALTGCGIQPSGVIGAGEPAGGLTKAPRIYYVRDDRLQGVSRPDTEIDSLADVTKLLMEDPMPAEQERGLVNLVQPGAYTVSGSGTRITLSSPGTYFSGARTQLSNGQWVCSLARAQAALDKKVRPDDVQVTLDGDGTPLGPYQCSQFLKG